MHHFLESEMLAIKSDGGIDIVHDIANLYRSHEFLRLPLISKILDRVGSDNSMHRSCRGVQLDGPPTNDDGVVVCPPEHSPITTNVRSFV
jgi:hypothetical protein